MMDLHVPNIFIYLFHIGRIVINTTVCQFTEHASLNISKWDFGWLKDYHWLHISSFVFIDTNKTKQTPLSGMKYKYLSSPKEVWLDKILLFVVFLKLHSLRFLRVICTYQSLVRVVHIPKLYVFIILCAILHSVSATTVKALPSPEMRSKIMPLVTFEGSKCWPASSKIPSSKYWAASSNQSISKWSGHYSL